MLFNYRVYRKHSPRAQTFMRRPVGVANEYLISQKLVKTTLKMGDLPQGAQNVIKSSFHMARQCRLYHWLHFVAGLKQGGNGGRRFSEP